MTTIERERLEKALDDKPRDTHAMRLALARIKLLKIRCEVTNGID